MSRSILSPPIVVMGTRRYRQNIIHDGFGVANSDITIPGYQEQDLYDNDDEDTYEVEELEDSVFRTSFHVPRVFYGGLIGQKGMTKRRIESETKTEIIIPGPSNTSMTFLTIKGKSRKDVCAARRRIELVAESMRAKVKPTHFTCTPACTDEIMKSFDKLKESILKENMPGIDEDLFLKSERLHITFCSSKLLDDEERVKAAQVFNECKELLADLSPIKVTVRGLEIMNDDSSAVSVLYGGIESEKLQILANGITQKFKETNLMKENDRDQPKLHMTVMNVRGRIEKDPNSMKTFDAKAILEKYADYEFGTFNVSEVHLSQMNSYGPNGFYIATGIITV